jgi:TonB family protein
MSLSGDKESNQKVDTIYGADPPSAELVNAGKQDLNAASSPDSASQDRPSPDRRSQEQVVGPKSGQRSGPGSDQERLASFHEQVQRNFAALDSIRISSSISIAPGSFLDRLFSVSARERLAYLAALVTSLCWIGIVIQHQAMFETLPWCFVLLIVAAFSLAHYVSEKQVSLLDLLHIRTNSPVTFAESFSASYVTFSILLWCCLLTPGLKLKHEHLATRQVIDIELVSHADYADKNEILPGSIPKESLKTRKNEAPLARHSTTSLSRSNPVASSIATESLPGVTKPSRSPKPQMASSVAQKFGAVKDFGRTDSFAMKIAEQPRLGVAASSDSQASRRARAQPVLEEVAPPEMVEITDNQGDNGTESWQPGGHSAGGTGRKNQLVSYLKELHRRIKHAWTPPGGETRQAEILFRIKRSGSLASIKLVNSSGDSDADESAMHAIAACSPFQPLPNDFPAQYLDLQYTFNYSVDELSEVHHDSWQ